MKMINVEQNQAGTTYGLVRDNGTFAVYVLARNYAGHVRGGILATWRLCIEDVTEPIAREYFKKKLAGKVRR